MIEHRGIVVPTGLVGSARGERRRVEALDEIGIDIRAHHSKSVDTIDPATVDTVITLCAEEVCPVFLGEATRLHWPLPDPAGAPPDEALARFRGVRDALVRRIDTLR